ncbi:MAG: hypothetical protein U0174_05520 [Polyangiaceae bacterium]
MASRFSIRLIFSVIVSCILAIACGRAGLDDYALVTDAQTKCSSETCPDGCCDATGQCRIGSDSRACGNLGNQCLDCVAGGGTCAPQTKECGKELTTCDATSCPNGCCSKNPSGTFLCLAGSGDTACGKGGAACENCGASRTCSAATHACIAGGCGPSNCDGCCLGNQCMKGVDGKNCGSAGQACTNCDASGQKCTPFSGVQGGRCEGTPSCSPANCKGCCTSDGKCVGGVDQVACGVGGASCKACGAAEACNAGKCEPSSKCNPTNCTGDSCCFNDECVPGTGDTACGVGGAACQNCAGNNQTCSAGKCVAPTCSPATCPNGCCQAGFCVTGTQDDACGKGGLACNDCSANGRVCGAGNVCQVPCNAQTCGNGCCEGNTCRAGFGDARCGSGGAQCDNCTAKNQTCDINQRTCVAPNQCPEPYAGCPAAASTPVPVPVTSCSAQNLQDAAAACAQGANSGPCNAFFQFLAQTSPDCGTCLSPFKFPIGEGTGIFNCAAPFVDADCNHNTGCVTDCVESSCDQCGGAASTNACKNDVRNNQCNAFVGQSAACIGPAIQGAGGAAFCNPAAYPPANGRFGRWLAAVGTHYCNP